jgi:hypothetical protein
MEQPTRFVGMDVHKSHDCGCSDGDGRGGEGDVLRHDPQHDGGAGETGATAAHGGQRGIEC